MDKRVKRFLECAVQYAQGGEMPPRDLIGEVAELPAPLLPNPADARDYLWRILSYPERGRALAVLNAVDVLEEFVPSWTAYTDVRDFRLAAVEEVHLEHWADGLSEFSFGRVCRFHDVVVDERLNGWALTAFATLLCHDKESVAGYVSSLRLDLSQLGATDGEIERVVSIVTEYPVVYGELSEGRNKQFKILPGTLIAVLASMLANQEITKEQTAAAIGAADRWLGKI
ncbi:hypothetical protein HUU59_11655 [bacterium]|nr:hypothetical protein [bacterium]